MRVIEHDPVGAASPAFATSHFRTIPMTWRTELRVSQTASERTRTVSLQLFKRGAGGEMHSAGTVLHLFEAELPAILAALNEAAATLDTFQP